MNYQYYLFADPSFLNRYVYYLEKFSKRAYVEKIFKELSPEIKSYESQIKKEFIYYKYDASFLYKNAEKIRESLVDYKQKVKNNIF